MKKSRKNIAKKKYFTKNPSTFFICIEKSTLKYGSTEPLPFDNTP